MHRIQTALLNLSRQQDLGSMSLRQIAELVGASNKPQIVKHHLLQLQKAGLMQVDIKAGVIKPVNKGYHQKQATNFFYSIPIVGAANCGPAQIVAEECVEGYLKLSAKMLPRKKHGLYVLVADGPSMNKAEIHDGLTIEDGDFVLVDSSYSIPRNGDVVVAVIDGLATIKRYREDKANDRIVLEADSTENFLPIFIHEDDDFVVSGKVIDVIKKA